MVNNMDDYSNRPPDWWKRQSQIERQEIEADEQLDPLEELEEIKRDYFMVETYEDYLMSSMDQMDLDGYLAERDASPEPVNTGISDTEEAIYDYYVDKELYGW